MPNKVKQLMNVIVENYNRDAKIKSEVKNGRGQIYLYDVISDYWGVGASDIADALDQCGDVPIDLYINSPGGDVFDGRAMATLLKRHSQEVVAHIDGIAASAATTVACAANKRIMAEGTRFMIHNAWTLAIGNAVDLRETAELLDKLDQDIAADYVGLTGWSDEEVKSFMENETYFSAEECLDNGLCDEILKNDKDEDAEAIDNNMSRLKRFAQMLKDTGPR